MHPAGLLGFGVDPLLAHDVEQQRRTIADEMDEALARLAVTRDDVGGLRTGQGWNDLAVVAARCTPAGFRGFEHQDVDAFPGQMQRCRQAGEASADHQHVDREFTRRHRQHRALRGDGGPKRGRPFGLHGHRGAFRESQVI